MDTAYELFTRSSSCVKFSVLKIAIGASIFLCSQAYANASLEAHRARCNFAIEDAYQACRNGQSYMCGKLTKTVEYRCYTNALRPLWCEVGTHYRRIACMHGQGFACGRAGALARQRCDASFR